jgi:hypothetical protein
MARTPPRPKTCSNCCWWVGNYQTGDTGTCHLHPPTVVTTAGEDAGSFGVSVWPKTGAYTFCGQWSKGPA